MHQDNADHQNDVVSDESDETVIGILVRDHNGRWALTNELALEEGEQLKIVPTPKGQFLIVGDIDANDYSQIEALIQLEYERLN